MVHTAVLVTLLGSVVCAELAVHSISPNPAPRVPDVEFAVQFTGVEERHLSECTFMLCVFVNSNSRCLIEFDRAQFHFDRSFLYTTILLFL